MKEKTVKRRFWNEDLGWYEEREITTGKYKFTEEDKMSIVSEYVTSGRPGPGDCRKVPFEQSSDNL